MATETDTRREPSSTGDVPARPRADGRRPPQAYRSKRWSGRTRGGQAGNWFFIQIVKRFGIRAAYLVLAPVAAYFLIASPRSVRNSYRYLRRILGPQPGWKWPFLIYRHFFSLGMSLLDRWAMMMGRRSFTCIREGEQHIIEAARQGNGVVLIGAHVGNWAGGGYLLGQLPTRVNLVVLENERERVQRVFDREFPHSRFGVLSSTPDLASSMAIMNALRDGEIVIFNGDRALDGSPSVEVPFLGSPADFPAGPYLMAGVTGARVIQIFAMRDGVDRYRFFCFPAAPMGKRWRTERDAALRACAAEFAGNLETVLKQYPFQWYNFYPFWKHEA